MITENNIQRLENMVKHYAMQDYLRANTLKNGKRRKNYRPYTLSSLTNEAREMLHLARRRDHISKEDEEIVKGYLLRGKMIGLEC